MGAGGGWYREADFTHLSLNFTVLLVGYPYELHLENKDSITYLEGLRQISSLGKHLGVTEVQWITEEYLGGQGETCQLGD